MTDLLINIAVAVSFALAWGNPGDRFLSFCAVFCILQLIDFLLS